MQVCRGFSRNTGGPIALTIGNFDGVHLGHQAMLAKLKEAARQRNIPACVMIFEPHPKELFSPDQAPTRLTSLREKLELLASFGIDYVQLFHFSHRFAGISAEEFIANIIVDKLQARWVLVGDDFRFGAKRAGNAQTLAEAATRYGFEFEAMSSVTVDDIRVSSTAIRNFLAEGDLNSAKIMLGRDYSISGRVIGGNKLGKQLGFPTANIQMKHNRPPVFGIFAVEVYGIEQNSLPGVASLGVRPTVQTAKDPVLEVHLFNFDRNIYGKHIRVVFLHKLRDEERYPDLEALKTQIARDVQNAKAFLAGVSLAKIDS